MVSTRGLRYKFSEGERVLCYEPDPTKAKVLYDSKVLEVIESKDKRGRRTVEYLIHFQGWNSSWDRCVSEDFVLKDTEENRQLQRDLAEKSQLQLGAYLYRRERKKGSTATTSGPAKRTRQGFSDDGSSSSTQPEEGEAGDTDSSGSGSTSSTQRRSPPPNSTVGRAHIPLPSALRDRLTFDYHLVVKRGRLSRVPATPCAAEILESFVKWFARAGAWHPARGRHDPPQPPRPDLLDVSCRLNLVREVADGLRVYFDFILSGHLLYKQEIHQYHQLCAQFAADQVMEESTEEGEEGNASQDEEADEGAESNDAAESYSEIRSPRIPEYSHLPPDPSDTTQNTTTQSSEQEDTPRRNSTEKPSAKSEEPSEDSPRPTANVNLKPRERRTSTRTMPVRVARRLRSHKSAVSLSESEEPVPSTSGEQKTFETLSSSNSVGKSPSRVRGNKRSVGSSGSSLSDAGAMAAASPAPPPAHTRTPLSQLLDKVAKWQIIPREGTEHLPCRVYGAIHLARLFVKLPDFLNATQMPDCKLKLILKHIDMFIQYLDEHNEWFGEMYYVADDATRSN